MLRIFTSFLVVGLTAVKLLAQDRLRKSKQPFWKNISPPKRTVTPASPPTESTLPVNPETNKVSYSQVVEFAGSTKGSIYTKAKKSVATKGSASNPTITLVNEASGGLVAKGTFTLPAQRRKYLVQLVVSIGIKQGKYRYEFTDMVLQLETVEGGMGLGYAGCSSHSRRKAETLEYTLETFYPSRLTTKQPVVKYFEEMDAASFAAINREPQSLTGSLKQMLSPVRRVRLVTKQSFIIHFQPYLL